ncbi:Suppressor of the cold-sensitive snRNP biogenesis mutant brr1-1 [Aphanomyces cochlioides]|nr:Suppressor of the cold-sensitive snRNP biogenesis mutant brr1-1 [Aphanomyces cochlioides]
MKAALMLALAAAVAADKVAVRLARFFEASTESVSTTQVLVKFNVDIAAIEKGAASAAQPTQYVYDALKKASDENLKTLGGIIDTKDVEAIWIAGGFVIPKATKEIVDKLSSSSAITYLDLNAKDFSEPDVFKKEKESTREAAKNEWGVNTKAWKNIMEKKGWRTPRTPYLVVEHKSYYNGSGAVVGSIDTGALSTHEAIKDNYRSALGWFDPYNGTSAAYDSDGHGSHTIGTMAGVNGIGVAPGAKWISCLGLYKGSGDSVNLLKCAQFILCPPKPDGTGADCSKAPHVVNNSWGSTAGYNPWMEDAVAAWKAAGIIPVFSNGNSGPACGTVGNPGGYSSVIGVGAIGSYDNEPNLLAYFSSKGPQTKNGPAYVKPDISAPGFYTRSVDITTNSSYVQYAGTSMAAPHVSGVVALIKSVDPTLSYDKVYKYLTGTTDQAPLNTTEPTTWYYGAYRNKTYPGAPNCGSVKDSAWPNNRFGHSRVNFATILRDGSLHDSRRSSC